jgi:hypothetical protein
MSKQQNGVFFHAEPPPEDPRLGTGFYDCVIAIPARDEEALIRPCLEALAAQQDAPPFAVALVLNNCSDGTADVVRAMADQLPFELHVYDVQLPAHFSDAAWARRLAMNAAALLTNADGVILTTDADSRVDSRWVRNVMDCYAAGADIVCGFVAPDFTDAPALTFDAIRRGAMEYEYSQLTAEANAIIDPDPADPWPNHLVETGANLAIRACDLAALGGVPHICPGEDQRLVAMARRKGARIRHAFQPSVTTSSRVRGRASGGWGDDLMSRLTDERAQCHPKLEPARAMLRRAAIRARLRGAFGAAGFAEHVARYVSDPGAMAEVTAAARFSEAWAMLEDASPLLAKHPLLARDLEASVVLLRAYLQRRTARNEARRAQTVESR